MAPFVVKNIKTTLSLLTLLLVFEKIVTQKMTFIRFLDNESISVFQIKYFLIGALTYQLSNIFPERIFLLKFPKILLIFLIFYVANYKDELILLSGLLALLLPFLNSTTENSKIRTIGELSYPVYLIHYPIAKYVEDHVIAGYQFYVTTIISIAISMYLVRIFGPYLEDLRKRNRHQNGV